MILGSISILVALHAVATAVVPGWRGTAIPRLHLILLRSPVALRRGPASSLGVAGVCGTVGVCFWLTETVPQFNWGWLSAPLVVGFVLLAVGEWVDWVNFRRARARSLAERREQLLER